MFTARHSLSKGNLPIESDTSNTPFRRLMIAQDTGSAIVGPARADIYFGAGADAGRVAGRLKNPARFVMLLPNSLDPVPRGKTMPLPEDRHRPPLQNCFRRKICPRNRSRRRPRTPRRTLLKSNRRIHPRVSPRISPRQPQAPVTSAAPAAATAPVAQAVPLPEARPKTAPDVAATASAKPEQPRRKRHYRRYRHRQ